MAFEELLLLTGRFIIKMVCDGSVQQGGALCSVSGRGDRPDKPDIRVNVVSLCDPCVCYCTRARDFILVWPIGLIEPLPRS